MVLLVSFGSGDRSALFGRSLEAGESSATGSWPPVHTGELGRPFYFISFYFLFLIPSEEADNRICGMGRPNLRPSAAATNSIRRQERASGSYMGQRMHGATGARF